MTFEAWGRLVHRRRWAVLAASGIVLGLSIFGLARGGGLDVGAPAGSTLEAQRASDLIASGLPSQRAPGGSSFLLIFRSGTLAAADPRYQAALEAAVAPLRGGPHVTGVVTPYDLPAPQRPAAISRDGHEALVTVSLADASPVAGRYYQDLRDRVHSDVLTVQGTGNVPINRAFSTTLEADLQRAEVVSLPITLILLLIVFGSLLAALLPLSVGGLTIVGGLGGTLLLADATFVSQYALNIVTLIGLGVSIDYSLFVVNRFREELACGASREEAMATTMATAGRAIAFSAVTVAVGLSAMLFYQGSFLASMGAAGAIVVAVAIFYGLTFLPALLAILGPRVDWLRLPFLRPRSGNGFWHALATWVMRRPVVVLVPVLALLIAAGLPFLGIRLANGDVDQLPPRLEARQAYDTLVRDFPGQDETSFVVVLDYGAGSPRAADLDAMSARLAAVPGVLRVTAPRTGAHVAEIQALSAEPASSDAARATLGTIRGLRVDGARLLVTGQTAYDLDVVHAIQERTPLAVAAVAAVTLIVLFLLTGSVVLPVVALLTNLLSISASFGALVWIFQQGHLSAQLGFTPQSLDPSIPVILFSIVFGLSMDYQVLMLSRIQEERRRTGDTTQGVAMGLQRCGRLITSAAAIMVVVFGAFGLGEVVIIKAIGIGLAIAVALDATVVRALLMPAVMRLLGDRNWWAPARLASWSLTPTSTSGTRAATTTPG